MNTFHEHSLASFHLKPKIFSPCSGILGAQGSSIIPVIQVRRVLEVRMGWDSKDQNVSDSQQGGKGEQVGRACANPSYLSRHGVANGCWCPGDQHCTDAPVFFPGS